MKKIVTFFLLYFSAAGVSAQITTNLIMAGNPPASLTEWADRKDALLLQVAPAAGLRLDYKIKTEIRLLDGTVIARNDLAKAATYQTGSAVTLHNAVAVLQLELLQFSGKYKTAFEKTGKLISDNYQLCTRLVRPTDFTPVSEEKCRTFYVASLQLPILMKPADDEEMDYNKAKTAIIFRWSPLVPAQTSPVTYRLMVFEVLDNQNPVQAMRSNMPVLTKDVKGTTQYIWQPQGILGFVAADTDNGDISGKENKNDSAGVKKDAVGTGYGKVPDSPKKFKKYVWTIQVLDATGKPVSEGNINGDGVTEPKTFKVVAQYNPKELQVDK